MSILSVENKNQLLVFSQAESVIRGPKPLDNKSIEVLYSDLFKSDCREKACAEVGNIYHVAHLVHALFKVFKETTIRAEYVQGPGTNEARFLMGKSKGQYHRLLVCKKTTLATSSYGVSKKGGAPREKVAYLLDQNNLVPPTVCLISDKLGIGLYSAQVYVPNTVCYASLKEKRFAEKSLVVRMRQIVFFNLYIVNQDPNRGNLLVGQTNAYSIDHGYCLPEKFDAFPMCNYEYQKITALPFSEEEKLSIMALKSGRSVLEQHSINASAISIHEFALTFLQKGVQEEGIDLLDLVRIRFGTLVQKHIYGFFPDRRESKTIFEKIYASKDPEKALATCFERVRLLKKLTNQGVAALQQLEKEIPYEYSANFEFRGLANLYLGIEETFMS